MIDDILLLYVITDDNIEKDTSFLDDVDSIDDYIVDDIEPVEESIEFELAKKTEFKVDYIKAEDTNEEFEYSEMDFDEDYTSYHDLEVLDEEAPDELRLDFQYIMSLNDGADPDEVVLLFWQRYIAQLPEHLWYMNY